MASIRRKLIDNENDSKNTRMDIHGAGQLANWRPDELAHISRYCKIAELIMDEAKALGRPISCFEAGCGQVWTLRYLYKAIICTKAEQVQEYHGYDIDPAILDDFWYERDTKVQDATWFKAFNGRLTIRDLTTNPTFEIAEKTKDHRFDFFWTTEVIEHMKREFVEPWIAAAAELLRPGGLAYVSTPNSDGSREKLPKDHVYEWGHAELRGLLEKYFTVESVTGVFIQQNNVIKGRRQWPDRLPDEVYSRILTRFDPNWQRVVLAMMFPEISNNNAWTLRKK